MRRVEVRTKSQQGNVLGWLPVLPTKVNVGERVRFVVMQRPGQARVAPFVELEVCRFESQTAAPRGPSVVALELGDVPVEILRRIPGFIEVGTAGLQPEEVT